LQVWENRALGDLSLLEWFWSAPTRTRLIVRSKGYVADRVLFRESLLVCLDVLFLEDSFFFLADFFFSLVVLFLIFGCVMFT
jgi:hypothetical protein